MSTCVIGVALYVANVKKQVSNVSHEDIRKLRGNGFAPAMNQMARAASKIVQLNEDLGMNGQMRSPNVAMAFSVTTATTGNENGSRHDRTR